VGRAAKEMRRAARRAENQLSANTPRFRQRVREVSDVRRRNRPDVRRACRQHICTSMRIETIIVAAGILLNLAVVAIAFKGGSIPRQHFFPPLQRFKRNTPGRRT